ncbi:MAG: thiamine pyrophosphate-dependent enzyme [Acetobacteraceae bacterium]|nr:thiamine pyrophosphate-dependent enzyme [Acetobacteraceae bacterium]
MTDVTAAEELARWFKANGVTRVFGMPGGGSSLDIIEAAARAGIPFTLARTEAASVFMAATTAEITGSPGAVLVTRGPGLASAVNGLAHAALDRAPVLLISDGFTEAQRGFVTHQVLDQAALAAPVVRAAAVSNGADIGACLARLGAAMQGPCRGPALLELADEAARRPAVAGAHVPPAPPAQAGAETLAAARALVTAARRPAIIAGLEAREAAAETRALAHALGAPVLVTYKAKGVVADDDPLFAGVFTGGAAEAALLRRADLIILAGADPVEFIPQRWRYDAPVIDVARFARGTHYFAPAALLEGEISPSLDALAAAAPAPRAGVANALPSDWTVEEISEARAAWLRALANPGAPGRVGPERVVTIAAEACAAAGVAPRAAVDAGAHMFSATTFWPAAEPNGVLISNGLATMGFALPAAIAAALAEPGRPALAFTGDGGLLMCLGELATAAALRARVVVVVFNDAGLSLIALKVGERQVPEGSLAWAPPGFAEVARGLGCAGVTVETEAAYRDALAAALTADGPTVIDVRIDPSGYPAQMAGARG